jgi:LysM repeat protein
MSAIALTWQVPQLPRPVHGRARAVGDTGPRGAGTMGARGAGPTGARGRSAGRTVRHTPAVPKGPLTERALTDRPLADGLLTDGLLTDGLLTDGLLTDGASRRTAPAVTDALRAEPGVEVVRSVVARPAVRLTRRGRVLLGVVGGALAVAGALSAQSAVADAPGEAVPVVTRTVVQGETLWSIAGSVARPGEDLRDVVDRLESLNGLTGSAIRAGQELVVPAP